MKEPPPTVFDDLLDLALSQNAGRRAALIRALLDDFVRDDRPRKPSEVKPFEELMQHLLDTADPFTRAVVAQKLAPRRDTPLSIVERLALDEDAVSEPILVASPLLSAELIELVIEGGSLSARAALARRGALSPRHRALLAATGEADVLRAIEATSARPSAPMSQPAAPPMPPQNASQAIAPVGAASPPREMPPVIALSIFLEASPAERRAALAPAKRAVEPRPSTAARDVERALVRAVVLRQRQAFVTALAAALTMPISLAQRIVDDPLGEPFVVAARALDLSEDALAQLLLLGNPAIGHSVEKVFSLRALYRELDPEVAQRFIATWRTETLIAPSHQPVHAPARERPEPMKRERPTARKTFGRALPRQ